MIQRVLLAAGKSERFGANKLVTKLSNSRPIALQSEFNLKQVVRNTIAMINFGQLDLNVLYVLLNSYGIETVVSEFCVKGMGNTISDAIYSSADV